MKERRRNYVRHCRHERNCRIVFGCGHPAGYRSKARDYLLGLDQVGFGGAISGDDPRGALEEGRRSSARSRLFPSSHRMGSDKPSQTSAGDNDLVLHACHVEDEGGRAHVSQHRHHRIMGAGQNH